MHRNDTYVQSDADNYRNNTLTQKQRDEIGLILYYGYYNKATTNNCYAYLAATQPLCWELVSGYRSFAKDNTAVFAKTTCNVTSYYVANSGGPSKASVASAYNTIVKKFSRHKKVPASVYTTSTYSKNNPVKLIWNNGTKRYET